MSEELNEAQGVESVLGGKKVASKKDAKVEMTFGDLESLISKITESSNQKIEAFARLLSDAIIESKKPYVSDAQKANEKAMRESMVAQRERLQRDLEASQESCPHLQGSNALSDFSGQLTSIVYHRLDTGAVIGICTNCLRVFKPGDKDYIQQMKRKSGNRISSAGIRMFLDPARVQAAGL